MASEYKLKQRLGNKLRDLIEEDLGEEQELQEKATTELENADLLLHTPEMSSPEEFAKSVTVDNPRLEVTEQMVENAESAETLDDFLGILTSTH